MFSFYWAFLLGIIIISGPDWGLPCDFHLKLESETAIRWRRRHRWKKAGDREFWSSVPPVSASAPFSLVRASFFLDTIAFF